MLVPSILQSISARFAYILLSSFILSSIPFVAFLYDAVTTMSRRWLHSSFANLYMFEVLSAGISVLFDDLVVFRSSLKFIWKFLSTLRNLRFYTKSTMSSSNAIRSFTLRRHLYFLLYTSKNLLFVFHRLIVFAVVLHVVVVFVNFHIVKDSFPPNVFDN